MLTGNITLSKI